jgi:hypothetical protein
VLGNVVYWYSGSGVMPDLEAPGGLVGDAVETFISREDAERFVEDVRGDDPELASNLRMRRGSST